MNLKILERDLSSEDKQIIDLAYKMGHTSQFLVDDFEITPTENKQSKNKQKPKQKNSFMYKKRR